MVPPNFDSPHFLNYINSIYPTLKFTFEWEDNSKLPFLDVLIHNCGSCLKFSVFRKPTNAEAYLHYFSFSELHIKIGIAQSVFIRALRICSRRFLHAETAYPKHILLKALSKAKRTHFKYFVTDSSMHTDRTAQKL